MDNDWTTFWHLNRYGKSEKLLRVCVFACLRVCVFAYVSGFIGESGDWGICSGQRMTTNKKMRMGSWGLEVY